MTNEPDHFINRELSLLAFNRRVLELALDDTQPLLERLRFLGISNSNLDEFFEVRVAGLKQQQRLQLNATDPSGKTATQQLISVSKEAHQLVEEQYNTFNNILIPELKKHEITFVRRSEWNETQALWVKNYFRRELLPLITPLGLDHAHPFPRILNKSLNFIIELDGKDAFGRDSGLAIVRAPRALPRIIRMPDDIAVGKHSFVFLSSIIHAHVSDLFAGMQISGVYQFRVTRNSNLFVSEDTDDLLDALKGELPARNYGDSVRLEIANNCPVHVANFLMDKFQISNDDLYQVNGPVNLHRVMQVLDLMEEPSLCFPPFNQGLPKALTTDVDIFSYIEAQKQILLHHPFQSFNPVVNFIEQAANDPKVVAIKMTLYRTGSNSAIADALVAAAANGKEVTAVIELRARFDEAANIALATRLQEAGAYVAYGVVGYKTHAKLTLVIRKQGRRLKRYVHLGTGNYHAGTAKAYTDYGMLTDDHALGEDVLRLFTQLTGMGNTINLKKLCQAPFTLHKRMMQHISTETENARQGKKALIQAKMNSLVEPKVISAMYEASQAGVKINLIIRGVCCLRAGVPGLSENIRVRSVMGRFLEHTRVFYFLNDGEENIYLSSADWMPRNFFKRVESCFPIENPELKQQIKSETFDNYMSDNTQSWALEIDGSYKRIKRSARSKPRSAHDVLLKKFSS